MRAAQWCSVTVAGALCAVAGACRQAGTEELPALVASAQPNFTVRGRLEQPGAVCLWLDPRDLPLPLASYRAVVEQAVAVWRASGVVDFVLSEQDQPAATVIAWRRGAHDDCPPFGIWPGIAHTGPFGQRSFVHLDADQAWREGRGAGPSLLQALVHELGHVLGLGHSSDPAAAMHELDDPRRAVLTASDLAGLHSLYGGGQATAGDLSISRARDAGVACAVLYSVAPPDCSNWTTFDTDGDGAEEVLVWRTDAAGYGELMLYFFAEGAQLRKTVGPLPGAVLPQGAVDGAVSSGAEPLLVVIAPDGRLQVAAFDVLGLLNPRGPEAGLVTKRGAEDLDGDGRLDDLSDFEMLRERGLERRADLDGDGQVEIVRARLTERP